MGDGAEEREREIFVEKHFLIGRIRGSGLIEFPFISAPFTDSISNISKAGGGGEGEKCGEDTRGIETGTNRRNSSPDGSRIFLRLKVEVTVRPNDERLNWL